MLLRVKVPPGFLRGDGFVWYSHPTAALQLAAKEAWMSINPLHRIAARLRFGVNLKGFGLGGKR